MLFQCRKKLSSIFEIKISNYSLNMISLVVQICINNRLAINVFNTFATSTFLLYLKTIMYYIYFLLNFYFFSFCCRIFESEADSLSQVNFYRLSKRHFPNFCDKYIRSVFDSVYKSRVPSTKRFYFDGKL